MSVDQRTVSLAWTRICRCINDSGPTWLAEKNAKIHGPFWETPKFTKNSRVALSHLRLFLPSDKTVKIAHFSIHRFAVFYIHSGITIRFRRSRRNWKENFSILTAVVPSFWMHCPEVNLVTMTSVRHTVYHLSHWYRCGPNSGMPNYLLILIIYCISSCKTFQLHRKYMTSGKHQEIRGELGKTSFFTVSGQYHWKYHGREIVN